MLEPAPTTRMTLHRLPTANCTNLLPALSGCESIRRSPTPKVKMAALRFRSAFFAFPGRPHDLAGPINAVSDLVDKDRLKLQLWPEMPIFGVSVPDQVRDHIRAAEVLICDVTMPNLNVYYEV